MCEWVRRLDPDAGEAQLLAARAHHLRRWTVPRDSQPEGRSGYLRWRAALRRQHAEDVAAILAGAGYDPDTVERVQRIIRKEGLGTDPEVQTHEDALCLVFLETQLAQTADRLGPDKMRSVAAKTMAKMSQQALDLVAELPLRPEDLALLAQAADPPSG
jgi:hypothetical protein